jgi:hypothetical protein
VNPNLNHGKWTTEEIEVFDEALKLFQSSYNWQELSEYVGTRTPLQCKDRYELKYFLRDKYINWTPEEDKLLLEAYERCNGRWVSIANEFPNRNDHACLFRYNRLASWRQQNEWFMSQRQEVREFLLFINKKRHTNGNQGEDSSPLYTETGQLVPKQPRFVLGPQALATMIDKIKKNEEYVVEFINKKNEGKLNLPLLNQIGIFTPSLNGIINKLKNQNSETNKENTSSPSSEAKKKKKKKKKSPNSQSDTETDNESNENNTKTKDKQTKTKQPKTKKIKDKKSTKHINQLINDTTLSGNLLEINETQQQTATETATATTTAIAAETTTKTTKTTKQKQQQKTMNKKPKRN